MRYRVYTIDPSDDPSEDAKETFRAEVEQPMALRSPIRELLCQGYDLHLSIVVERWDTPKGGD
jgi:hypothetical protein